MAKSKHTINDIQKALMSNTKYIKEDDMVGNDSNEKPIEESSRIETSHEIAIDPIAIKKIRILATYLGETPDELVNKALNHFLRLKSMQLDQAIAKLTEE